MPSVSNFHELIASFPEKFQPHPDGASLPSHHGNCLGCGENNPHGHRLRVRRTGDAVAATHTFDNRHEGAPGIVHGGALATVIDDLYGFLQYLVGGPAVTRELRIEYLRPALLDLPYDLQARLVDRRGRRLEVAATISDESGITILSSTAVFVLVDVSHFADALRQSFPAANPRHGDGNQ